MAVARTRFGDRPQELTVVAGTAFGVAEDVPRLVDAHHPAEIAAEVGMVLSSQRTVGVPDGLYVRPRIDAQDPVQGGHRTTLGSRQGHGNRPKVRPCACVASLSPSGEQFAVLHRAGWRNLVDHWNVIAAADLRWDVRADRNGRDGVRHWASLCNWLPLDTRIGSRHGSPPRAIESATRARRSHEDQS